MSVSTQWSVLPVQGKGMKEGNCDARGPGNGERKWKSWEGKSEKEKQDKILNYFYGNGTICCTPIPPYREHSHLLFYLILTKPLLNEYY